MGVKKTKSLKELTETWMAMERKTFAQREKAEAYYEKNLMQLIVENYRERNKDMIFEKVDYLILSVGASFEPLVLNISLLQPKKILFLYTEGTERILDKIVNYLSLDVSAYQKYQVEATDSLSIYQEIKRAYLSWNRPEKVYIDFTGGTKAMSAAAALAGSLIDVQLVYVGTGNYLTDFRKPEPGSEELFYIDNPLEVFGDLELEKVLALIGRYNYAGAAEKLEQLKERIPDPLNRQQINFVYLLVKAYEHWDALEFEEACSEMGRLLQELKRDYRMHKKILMMDFQAALNHQYKILKKLEKIPELTRQRKQKDILSDPEMMNALMFTMYKNAMRREEQEKYDMATLLLYRLLEMIEQRRLIQYQIYISRPEYDKTDYTRGDQEYQKMEEEERLAELKRQYGEIKKNLFHNNNDRGYLPNPISLLDGYMILAALGDEISKGKNGKTIGLLQHIRSMVSLRNNSIFAHGLGPVKAEDYRKFRDFVNEMFQKYCEIENVDFEAYDAVCCFLNPVDSKYYSMVGNGQ